jgi:hypothetical protein
MFLTLGKGPCHPKTFTKIQLQHSLSDSLELGQSSMCDCIKKQTMTNVYSHCKAQQYIMFPIFTGKKPKPPATQCDLLHYLP